jgi:hypothetical protein
MKIIKIGDESYNVENKVHDLLCWYSSVVQATEICRNAQKAYFAKQDQERLKRAKAMEKKLDDLLTGNNIHNKQEQELLK